MPGVVRGDRRLLVWVGGLVVAMSALAMLIAGSGASATFPSTYATDSGGAKASYLLLRALGYDAVRWERPPVELSQPERTTLILAEPFDQPTVDERAAVLAFIDRGGRVVATGAAGAAFLGGRASRDTIEALGWRVVPASAPSHITRAAPQITISPATVWDTARTGRPLYGADQPVVVRITRGGGDAYWWAAATPLTNAGLSEPGNLEFFLTTIGAPGDRRVLFDEYFHGSRPTLAASIAHSPAKWLGIQLAIIMVVVMLTFSRRSGPILTPAVEPRLSPLEFARTLGSLYDRAGAAQVPVSVALKRLRTDLARRLGLPITSPDDTIARAAAARWQIDAGALSASLRAGQAAASDPDLTKTRALAQVRALATHAETVQARSHTSQGTP
jgi:hypothetical protein